MLKSIFLYETHIHVLKEKCTITWYVMCFVPGISTSENLFKEIERVNSSGPGRSTIFEEMLIWRDEIYSQNEKFKAPSTNNSDNDKQ